MSLGGNIMRKSIMASAVLFVTLLGGTTAMAADIDTTTGSYNGDIYAFGYPDTATYGQTFTAGGANLSSFSLYLTGGYTPVDLKGYIATWDGSKAGTLVYSSDVRTMNSSATPEEFAFAPNVSLVDGQQYVAFLSVSEVYGSGTGSFGMPSVGDETPGQFVYMNNEDNFGALFNSDWNTNYAGDRDVFFKASFSAAPEPASWALMLGGFGAIGGALRTRRKTAVSFG